MERLLAMSERIASAAEGRAVLASDEGTEAVGDQLHRLVVLSVPVLRAVAKGAKFTKVPWVLVGTTAISTGITVRTGVREVQVLGSLVAHRIELATGQPADPALVKKLTVELYLAPKRLPDLSNRRLRLDRLMRRWVFRGAVGRKTGRAATKALAAAERLDMGSLVAQWAELGPPSSPPPPPGGAPSGRRALERSHPSSSGGWSGAGPDCREVDDGLRAGEDSLELGGGGESRPGEGDAG